MKRPDDFMQNPRYLEVDAKAMTQLRQLEPLKGLPASDSRFESRYDEVVYHMTADRIAAMEERLGRLKATAEPEAWATLNDELLRLKQELATGGEA